MDYMDPDILCSKTPDNLITHSLTHSLQSQYDILLTY